MSDLPPSIRPCKESLIRFFTTRGAVSIDAAAALLGCSRAAVRRTARAAGVQLLDGHVPWEELAAWLLDRWPLPTIVEELGIDAGLLPHGLHPITVALQQPAYLLHALRAQWHLDTLPHRTFPASTFDAYLTDVLHRAIEPETIAALKHDLEFMRAYTFPRRRYGMRGCSFFGFRQTPIRVAKAVRRCCAMYFDSKGHSAAHLAVSGLRVARTLADEPMLDPSA